MIDQPDPKAPAGPEESESSSAAAPAETPAESAVTPTATRDSHGEFARLLATSADAKRFAKGALVRGTVVQIGETDLLIDVGGKSEALMARDELTGEDGVLGVQIGDSLEATVVSIDGTLRLSRKLMAGARSKEMLMEAFKTGMPVQGRVTASIKGGYEVHVAGVRGFCPFSQIDVRRQEDPTLYFNKTFDFLIKEYEPRKRNLILSRRALIEIDRKKQEAEVRAKIIEGAVLTGTVVSLMDFGAFIDLGGGVQGLLHVSEISPARVAKPSDVLTLGQNLQVQVLRLDPKKGKISLTRKPLESDPWSGISERLTQGQMITAKAVRVTEFGAFLELAPGVDGLLHVSELSGRASANGQGSRKATDLVKPGEELQVQVIKVDEAKRRVSLGLGIADKPASQGRLERDGKRDRHGKPDKPAAATKPAPEPVKIGEVVTGTVDRVEKYGVFIRFGNGRSGMIPNSELGTQRGADHRRMFPAGTELKAEIIEADAAGRKIRLSVTKAMGREEREALDKYRKETSRASGSSFSTMADAFAAIKKATPRDDEST